MEIDRYHLEVLDRDECLRLLKTAGIGRLAITLGSLPTVRPVHFEVDGDQILVRTTKGSQLDAALRDAVVAFEADQFDDDGESGWSVVVTGLATDALHPDQLSKAGPGSRWAPDGQGRTVRISTELISGRRFVSGYRSDARVKA